MTTGPLCACGCAVAAWSLGPSRPGGVRRRTRIGRKPAAVPSAPDADGAAQAASRAVPRPPAAVPAVLPERRHPFVPHDYGLDPLAFDELDELEDHR
ncbi:hypothetical protein FHR81_003407 [Actinoalloteichus hoggarensis]|uniref:Uncharacterized protein n=1 Tax=Actinoalloteichus hoggarensis TaxID=1470176 RepID=A0A221W777_9PSEU|nr:hypothetical protein [Actinoalloteichus hoggarensis]ASO21758.1 hypothetical protein AHOG_20705 [Actinoalloteichus hoggarensis]MBB5922355.1 hypothetical protein [Actinoalloteichus hoggarensis]